MASTCSNSLRCHLLRTFQVRVSFVEQDRLWACTVHSKVRFVSLCTEIQTTKDGGQNGSQSNAVSLGLFLDILLSSLSSFLSLLPNAATSVLPREASRG